MVDAPNGNGAMDEATLKAGLAALPQLPPLESLRTAEEFRAAASVVMQRWQFFNQAGITFGGKRDAYQVLGYKRVLTNRDYRDRYERGGVAGRVVDVMPDATWRGSVEVREDKDEKTDTAFEKAWKDIDKRLQVQAKLRRVDKLSRLSNYAVLLIGAGGSLQDELPKGAPDGLLYLTAFSGGGGPGGDARSRAIAMDADCTIATFDTNIESERFGLPLTYQLKRIDVSSPALQHGVHWSRILHVAEELLDNDVYGQPALERVWNLFDDLDKVTGGGAEAFWMRANAGLHLNVDKDMSFPPPKAGEKTELEKLRDQAEDYAHQMTRIMRTKGVDVSQLGSDVANFGTNADAVLTQIAGAKAIPKRILTGSEMGELASSQDRENFKDQVNGRQTLYAGPYILRPLVDRLIKYGYLPVPTKGPDVYDIVWPHVQTLTEQEKAEGAQKWASTNQALKNAGMNPAFTDAELRDKWYGLAEMTPEELARTLAPVPEPPAPVVPEPAPFAAAAAHEDEETLRVLEAAIAAGNTDVIDRILDLERPARAPDLAKPLTQKREVVKRDDRGLIAERITIEEPVS